MFDELEAKILRNLNDVMIIHVDRFNDALEKK